MRIASLMPSATEIIRLLDAGAELVGTTHECEPIDSVRPLTIPAAVSSPVRPDMLVREEPVFDQSVYTLDTHELVAAAPDLIIFGPTSTDPAQIDQTADQIARRTGKRPRLLALSPLTLEDILDAVLTVGEAIGRAHLAQDRAVGLRARLFSAQEYVASFDARQPVVGFLEWADPLVIAGHWRVQMIERAGGSVPWNPTVPGPGSGAAAGPQQAQRRAGPPISITADAFSARDPDVIIVAPQSQPLDSARATASELVRQDWCKGLRAVATGQVFAVDGRTHFFRPGPGVVEGLEWLVGCLQGRPELMHALPWMHVTA